MTKSLCITRKRNSLPNGSDLRTSINLNSRPTFQDKRILTAETKNVLELDPFIFHKTKPALATAEKVEFLISKPLS
jgi:hypothetical protein